MPRAYRPIFTGIGTYNEKLLSGGTYESAYGDFDVFSGSSLFVKLFWGTSTNGTKQFGSFWFPEGYFGGAIGSYGTYFGGNSSPGDGTLFIGFYGQKTWKTKESINSFGTVPQLSLSLYNGIFPPDYSNIKIFLPPISNYGTTYLWVGTNGWTYYDSAFATLAAGSISYLSKSDSGSISDINYGTSIFSYGENILCTELYGMRPRKYPPGGNSLSCADSLIITAITQGTITDWNFSPRYKLFADLSNSGTYATTNWNENIFDYGNLRKSVKHWTGDFEVGNWSPLLADPDNELWGSFYGGTNDIRKKNILLQSLVNMGAGQYVTQFSGEVISSNHSDGKISIEVHDKINGLSERKFVYDYACLGSQTSTGKNWGIVKKVFGTQVMFDDYGDVKWIQVKRPGVSIWQTVTQGLISAAVGFVSSGFSPVGAGVGFGLGVAGNLPRGDTDVGGYYEIRDNNAIPDDIVSSGQKIKFFKGSISGVATNLNSPLVGKSEYSIIGGTFRFGVYGTLQFESTDGVSVGDFIYVRKPLFFSGGPNEILKSILCGSNIDYPYSSGNSYSVDTTFGLIVIPTQSDFDSQWDSQLNSYSLLKLSRGLTLDESNPFDLIKELVGELRFTFYINENNKFAIRTPQPKGLITSGQEATYTHQTNILSGFSFNKSIDDAMSGISMYYDYLPGQQTTFQNGYNRKIEMRPQNPLSGINNWGTIESKWIHLQEDAQTVCWRLLNQVQQGVDSVTIPTTLYGMIHNLSDLIRVTHTTGSLNSRLFEIVEYDKNPDSNTVTLVAKDVQNSYGAGNSDWYGTCIDTNSSIKSGFSYMGPIGSLTSIGSISNIAPGTLSPLATSVALYKPSSFDISILPNSLICTGSSGAISSEICFVENAYVFASNFLGLVLRRGMFNTIPRTVFTDETFYYLGKTSVNPITGEIEANAIFGSNFRSATSNNINSNIGTCFKFF